MRCPTSSHAVPSSTATATAITIATSYQAIPNTTANINASLDNTPASQKSTASHTSRNPSTLTAFNLLHNRPSGDALDDCPGPLSDSIRIYFQNVNGLRTSANGLDILYFYCQMKDIDATIFGINEVNQDTQHPYIRQLLHAHQRRVWDNSKLQYASSKLDIGTI
jgi:hypothetical protein